MDPSLVTIRYSPAKWAQAHENGQQQDHPNYLAPETLKTGPRTSPKIPAAQYYTRRKHIQVLSSLYFHKSTEDSIKSMNSYPMDLNKGFEEFKNLETSWYGDLINVGQRLKLLRDAFKVIQTVRKKKALGLKVDFKPVYDTKTPRMGSPAHLDDEGHLINRTDDDDDFKVKEYPPPTRRGRPRKKRGRERKPTTGRGDLRAAQSSRTRLSRRQQERSSLPQASSPLRNGSDTMTSSMKLAPTSSLGAPQIQAIHTENTLIVLSPLHSELSRASPAYSSNASQDPQKNSFYQPLTRGPEPQGPPLMYLPPILPSQRLQLVQGIPPYKHLREIEAGVDLGGAAVSGNSFDYPKADVPASKTESSQSLLQIRPEGLVPGASPSTLVSTGSAGPAASELSDVFRLLAEGQAKLPAQNELKQPLTDIRVGGSSNLISTGIAAADAFPHEFKMEIPAPVQSKGTNSGTLNEGAPVDFEMQRVEMELAAALNTQAIPARQDTNSPSRGVGSDQSFISRLLN